MTAEALARRWQVQLGEELDGSTCSRVYAGQRGAKAVVLKVPFGDAEESQSGPVLRAFADHGGVPVLELDEATGAALMPRLGASLAQSSLCEGDRIDVCADLILNLRDCRSMAGTMTVADYNRHERIVDDPLIAEANQISDELEDSKPSETLLHGDLHHGNILRGESGWVAIDPKGLLGDPSFEITGYIRNPIEPIDVATCRRRLDRFHERLGDPRDRLWGWAFSQTAYCGVGSDSEFTRICHQTAENLWSLRNEYWNE